MELYETVKIGSYYQTDETAKEPIEWLVIEKTAEHATLISKHIMLEADFNKKYASSWSWTRSSIRELLNTNFLNDAFSPEEQEMLCYRGPLSDKDKEELAEGKQPPKDVTYDEIDDKWDKVYLLTCNAATELMTQEQRKAEMTPYAYKKGIYKDHCWWVATRGYSSSDTIIVKSDGYLNGDAYDRFSTNGCGVRPCIQVRL